jgi:DNA-binding NarL/FixJ family response regulator
MPLPGDGKPLERVRLAVFRRHEVGGTIECVMSVLIVDDHPSFRACARALLQAEGFEIVGEAEDGVSALAAARALRPRLVLLDVQLPDTDGFALAAELTSAEDGPAVVLTSSRDAADFGPLVAESGARGFIPKAELCGATLVALLQ